MYTFYAFVCYQLYIVLSVLSHKNAAVADFSVIESFKQIYPEMNVSKICPEMSVFRIY